MKEIRIDHPGDGETIMEIIGARRFVPGVDHAICTHDNGRFLGGFVCISVSELAMLVHMAGEDTRWCSRDLMWMLFDYIFNQSSMNKALAMVSTGNPKAMAMDLRAGWKLTAVIEGVYADGDMAILSMDPGNCKWLKHVSKHYRSGT